MPASKRSAVEFDGIFDVKAAQRLDRTIDDARPGSSMLVDLRRVRDFHDAGLAMLARTILGSREKVSFDVRGLREHQHRMLRYLGVELASGGLSGDGALP